MLAAPVTGTTEERLLLGALSVAPERCAGLADLAERADWSGAERRASSSGVLPLVVSGLERARVAGLPGAVTDAAAAQRRANAARSGLAELVQADLSTRLEHHGVPCVPLKGAAFGRRIHGSGDLRRASADIDLLVRPEQLDEAVAVAGEAGYVLHDEPRDRSGRPLLHLQLVAGASVRLPPVEVHWRVHWYEASFAAVAVRRSTGTGADRRLRLADEALALLLFFVRDGLQGLRYPADLAAWWRTYGREVDPEEARDTVRRHPELARAVHVAARVADSAVGSAYARLLQAGPTGVRGRLAGRVATGFPDRREERLKARAALVDVLVAPRPALASVVVRAVAPRAGVEERVPSAAEVLRGLPQVGRRAAAHLDVVREAKR